ncbi:MAG: diguanylate cyclase [Pseudomonadota bacterium]|nr:diguanylate cyclase [Pseudomonadota bacterium]MDP1903674.1 diguanylate cyclase [Pseudomonadota bacterium]MDP2354373.1 diguanylate cyclase [Pseudomonadota bacterium]
MQENSSGNSGKLIFLWPATSADLQEAALQLGYYGYAAELFDTAADLLLAAGTRNPTSALVDCGAVAGLAGADKTALSALSRRVPLACMSNGGGIDARLGAVRMGCQAYFTRPLDMTSLLDTLDRLTAPPQAEAGRVLIVDDSPALAAFYAAHLNEAGFVTQVVTDPLKTLDALNEHPPELILLDMNMPGASGEEIAEVIRQQEAYLSIPIVFLSAESDVSRQREAMSLGGDEFLHKPIEPEHLISAVKSRVIRYRSLRALMVRDSLTGLLNHTSFKERLRAEAARAKRQGKPLSVALIDIDFFKKVNDTYGHPAGDRVIKNLSRLLKQRLRGADVIGRYGGEEFAVALPDTPIQTAARVIDNIRESFAGIVQHAGDKTFQVTLSAGVSGYDATSNGESLIQIADEALYVAKHGGRNQVKAAA